MTEPPIMVEVVHASPQHTWRCRVSLPAGSTVIQAVEAAGLLPSLPVEVSDPLRLGIFSRRVDAGHVLRDGERVEIYRPLAIDPMASRRRRAGQA